MAHIVWNDDNGDEHVFDCGEIVFDSPAAKASADQFAQFAKAAGWPDVPLHIPSEISATISGTFTLPDDSPLWRLPHALAANKGNN
jgi:hypothetical protein